MHDGSERFAVEGFKASPGSNRAEAVARGWTACHVLANVGKVRQSTLTSTATAEVLRRS
jgi:hypothetical protein